MALSLELERAGTPPARIDTDGSCTIEKDDDGFRITKLHLSVQARVPNVTDSKFEEIATATKETCPVSRALRGVEIELETRLVE